MPLYEHVFLARQDISPQQVEALVQGFRTLIEEQGGKLLARSRTVELSDVYGSMMGIKRGLHPGDRVIVTGASLVKDGEQVQAVP